jgi:hypothetical protein
MIWLTTCSACHLPCTVKYRNEEGTHKERELKATENMCGAKKTGNPFQSTNPPAKFDSSDLRISVYAIDTSS